MYVVYITIGFMYSLTLRGWAREEQVSLNKVQAVLSQICDYSPVSVNTVLELTKFYLN